MSKYLPPAEKLPLAVRKSVRDGYEAKKEGLEKQISDLLGAEWKVDVNPNALFPYAAEGSYGNSNLGGCIHEYISGGFIWNLKQFVTKYGPSGVSELNSAASTHVVTLAADEKPSYCGVDIKDGQLRLIFNPAYFGSNISQAGAPNDLEAVISEASKGGASALSFTARRGIETEYEAKIAKVLESCQKLLKMPNLQFDPNFEEHGKILSSSPDAPKDWETSLGRYTFGYFQNFEDSVKYNKFDTDDMLQETFQEEVSKAVIKLRIVEKLESGNTYNEILLKDGEILMQTNIKYWGVNIQQTAMPLVNIF